MNWNQLIHATAEGSGLSVSDARKALEAMRSAVTQELSQGGRVVIFGLGSLSTRQRSARSIRNVRDFRKMYIGERTSVVFKPASALKRAVAGGEAVWKRPEHQAAWRMAEALVGDLALYHGDRAPSGLAEQADEAARSRCGEAFGELWQRVLESYAAEVPETVRQEHDYLAGAARGRWP